MKLSAIFLPLYLSLSVVRPLLFDKEIEVINGYYSDVTVAIRHVDFIVTVDNGTLDCFIPGFTQFRWELINKVSGGPYTESASLTLIIIIIIIIIIFLKMIIIIIIIVIIIIKYLYSAYTFQC